MKIDLNACKKQNKTTTLFLPLKIMVDSMIMHWPSCAAAKDTKSIILSVLCFRCHEVPFLECYIYVKNILRSGAQVIQF